MKIGTATITDSIGKTVFESGFNNLAISNGRLFIELEGTYYPSIPLDKKQLYKISITGISEMEGKPLNALYEDYIFNAGSTDYMDASGNGHAGVCVLTNQLQFLLIG